MGSESFGISKEIENLIPAEHKLYIPVITEKTAT
jgi:hypothetical protein